MKIKIGNKLQVVYNENFYKSDVQDLGKDIVVISLPMGDAGYITPQVGKNIEVLMYDKSCIYKFVSKVLKRTNEDIPTLHISMPNEYKRVQRRKYVRVSYVNYAKFVETNSMFNPRERNSTIESLMTKCILMDLSGGGAKLKSTKAIKLDSTIALMIPLAKEDIMTKGNVVRVIKDEDGMYEIGIKFANMDEITREKLISYTFEIMRQHLNRSN